MILRERNECEAKLSLPLEASYTRLFLGVRSDAVCTWDNEDGLVHIRGAGDVTELSGAS